MNSEVLRPKSTPPGGEFFPAPWQLTGRGYVFIYRFAADFALRQGMIQASMKDSFQGGFGALMLVDYSSSDCGPYHELLFIPGNFQYQGRSLPSITKIFVSSEASVINGQRNWGIPKEVADFKVSQEADGSELWVVTAKGKEIFRARLTAGGMPLPIHSALTPNVIMQTWEKQRFFTKLGARGRGRLAKIAEIHGDGQSFPDLNGQKTFLGLGLKLDAFRMTFHVPKIVAEDAK